MKQRSKNGLDRRRFLAAGLSAVGGAALMPRLSYASRLARADAPATLVLVQLSGGNDGLSTVVPYGDDLYAENRRSTRLADEVLRLDDYRGLHPNLRGLHGRFQDGKLAIVEGVGYPNPNRSHFKSFEIWHTAHRLGRASGEGWVGKTCEAAFGDEADARRVVHIGGSVPYSLYSTKHAPSSFSVPAGYRWVGNEDDVVAYDERKEGPADGSQRSSLDYLRGVLRDARESSAAIRAAAARYHPAVEYPADSFAHDLRAAAALIQGEIGSRVISVELGGFDTHSGQRGRHDGLMSRLDGALSAFLADLEASEVGRRTLVLVFSEFGRRVAENASNGTDHGTAGPMFVAGAAVRGGLYGEHPSLAELDRGDLIHTTDFRSVYATAIETCFGIEHEEALGAKYPLLELV